MLLIEQNHQEFLMTIQKEIDMKKLVMIFLFFEVFNYMVSAEQIRIVDKEENISYFIIYYHSFDYPDIGRSVKALKNNLYELKKVVYYTDFSPKMTNNPFLETFEIENNVSKRDFKLYYGAQILIEIYNNEDNIIGWYSFDEADRSYIIIDGQLVKAKKIFFLFNEQLIQYYIDKDFKLFK